MKNLLSTDVFRCRQCFAWKNSRWLKAILIYYPDFFFSFNPTDLVREYIPIFQEKADGKNSAIEETKAMMLKMRLEEKAMTNKFRKEKGLPELEETDKSANFR